MSQEKDSGEGLSRRELLRRGAGVALAIPTAAALGALAACGEGGGGGSAAPAKTMPKADAAPAAPAAPAAAPKAMPSGGTPPAAAAPAAPAAAGGGGELITAIPANATLVASLQYTNSSPHADRNCTNCQLYTAGSGGTGKCALFQQGVVADAGWCQSWVPKQM